MATLQADKRVCTVHLHGDTVRAAQGAMVAYQGPVTFTSAGMGGGDGFRAALKRKVAGESLDLMECTGTGVVHLAADGADVTVVDLAGEQFTVESQHILAVTPGLTLDVAFAGLHGMSSGQGLATTTVTGTGQAAITSDGPLIALAVAPGAEPVVDPDAYVGSYGAVTMSMVSGVTWRSVVGDGGGEPFSLRFAGKGTVFIQPAER